ncbi:MAG TPA: TetR/AcrR family transcriptional regulator [Vicinamibacteria bacterium]|nr:TetR/AcrR family transcriptional regulator [Vicinamibacteria bacterium]
MSETKEALVEQYRRDTIQCAAQRVIARHGLRGASMSAIAEEAGVAKGTLYLYFKGRDDLLDQAADRIFGDLLARLGGVLAGERPLRESLRELVRTKLAFFDENQEFLRVYMALRLGGAEEARRHRLHRPRYARYVQMVTAYLAAAAARGEMKAFDPARVALFFAEGMSAILQRRLEETGRLPEEDVEWIVDLLLNGLCPGRRS